MTGQNTNPSLFFVQLADVAPAISNLLKTYTARLRASVTSHDVEGGYGFAITYHVFAEIFIRKCKNCGEHEYSRPHFDCKGHRYESAWIEIASDEGKDIVEALRFANTRVAAWLMKRKGAAS